MKTLRTLPILASSFFASLGLVGAQEVDLNDDPRDLLAHIPAYVQDKEAKMLLNSVEIDVFGLPQDLKAIEEKKAEVKQQVAQRKAGPAINQVLKALPMTLIDPVGNRIVLDGGPPLRAGETLEVSFGGLNVRLRLDGVRSQGAYFTDLDSGDHGLRPMTRLATGIAVAGGRSAPYKGIQNAGSQQPRRIEIEAPVMDLPQQEFSERRESRPDGHFE